MEGLEVGVHCHQLMLIAWVFWAESPAPASKVLVMGMCLSLAPLLPVSSCGPLVATSWQEGSGR